MVDGFWVGAMGVARRMPVADLARQAGGWDALRAGGAPLWRELGVPGPLAERWTRASSLGTRFEVLTAASPHYPERLAELPDAPPVLFCEGNLQALAARSVAIVGTRACTSYGRQAAMAIGRGAVQAGLCVISGLARGIDAAAHRGALPGPTVAVLGHGLSHTAPASNVRLRRAIVEAGGAMVSTWPDAVEPRPWTFPLRNRWIAALAEAVVVVEAPVKSGALHTVRAAADYGREVFAVPGPIGMSSSEGCNRLIAEGAGIVTSVPALMEQLGGVAGPAVHWLDLLVGGETLGAVSKSRGGSLQELLEEVDLLEATGELVRLPGRRYARG